MKNVLLNMDEEFHEKLKQRAKANHRSLKAEITHILVQELKISEGRKLGSTEILDDKLPTMAQIEKAVISNDVDFFEKNKNL